VSAQSTLPALQEELADIARQYETHFAGQSRATRSLPLLDRLVGRLDALRERVAGAGHGPAGDELRSTIEDSLRVYRGEREAIVTAQEAGPDFEAAAELASFANQVFGRYQRHFAGQSRNTRDLGLLREMIADLASTREGMERLRAAGRGKLIGDDLGLVERTLGMYQAEIGEIEKAQDTGSLDDKANLLAGLANSQFQAYHTHFSGRARLGRRPQLLERVIAALRDLELRMASLEDAGLKADFNAQNAQIVRKNRERYENELSHIRLARQEAGLEELLGHLGDEANEIFDEYGKTFAGKDRATVDLAALGGLCDRLGEIARQMRDLLRAVPSDTGRQNLEVVLGQLSMFETEWVAVHRRQQPAQGQGGQPPPQ
jgi:hypothetical protein